MKSLTFHQSTIPSMLNLTKTQHRVAFNKYYRNLMANADTDKNDKNYIYIEDQYGDSHHITDLCPFKIGDEFFVKETYAQHTYAYSGRDKDYIFYKATDFDEGFIWKPAQTMPEKFSRMSRIITGRRVEKLQDISEEDCVKEGMGLLYKSKYLNEYWNRRRFIRNWNSISKHKWESNSWVWVYTFKDSSND